MEPRIVSFAAAIIKDRVHIGDAYAAYAPEFFQSHPGGPRVLDQLASRISVQVCLRARPVVVSNNDLEREEFLRNSTDNRQGVQMIQSVLGELFHDEPGYDVQVTVENLELRNPRNSKMCYVQINHRDGTVVVTNPTIVTDPGTREAFPVSLSAIAAKYLATEPEPSMN